jgi:ribosome assembly protein YihI (activator of Der GTPase)
VFVSTQVFEIPLTLPLAVESFSPLPAHVCAAQPKRASRACQTKSMRDVVTDILVELTQHGRKLDAERQELVSNALWHAKELLEYLCNLPEEPSEDAPSLVTAAG